MKAVVLRMVQTLSLHAFTSMVYRLCIAETWKAVMVWSLFNFNADDDFLPTDGGLALIQIF